MAVRQKAMAALPKLIRSMRNEVPRQLNVVVLPSLRRAFSFYVQINLIDNVPEDQLRFQEFDETSFTVNVLNTKEACSVLGICLCHGALLTCRLVVFQTVRPIPEFLIIGCGRYNHQLNPQVRQFVKSNGMKLETVDSRNAASTYNILNEEDRIVAAALLPYGVIS